MRCDEGAFDGPKQFTSSNRLGHERIHSCFQATFAIAFHGMGGERDDRNSAAGINHLPGSNCSGRLEPIQIWQLHVHQNQVDGLRLKDGQDLVAVFGYVDLVSPLFQQACRQCSDSLHCKMLRLAKRPIASLEQIGPDVGSVQTESAPPAAVECLSNTPDAPVRNG